MRKHRYVWAFLALTLLATIGVAPSRKALADGGDVCLNGANSHNAVIRDKGTNKLWDGTWGQIWVPNELPVMCSLLGAQNENYSIANIALQGTPGNDQIGQIGIVLNTTAGGCECLRFFWEWHSYPDGTVHRALWGSPQTATYYEFRVYVNFNTDVMHLQYDPNDVENWQDPPDNQGGYHPYTCCDNPHDNFHPDASWTSTREPTVFEETFWQQDYYFGNPSPAPAFFNFIQIRNSQASGGNWQNANSSTSASKWGYVDDGSTSGGCSDVSDTELHLWDRDTGNGNGQVNCGPISG